MILYVWTTKCLALRLHEGKFTSLHHKDVIEAHNHDNDTDSYSNLASDNVDKGKNEDDFVCLDHEMLGSEAS